MREGNLPQSRHPGEKLQRISLAANLFLTWHAVQLFTWLGPQASNTGSKGLEEKGYVSVCQSFE